MLGIFFAIAAIYANLIKDENGDCSTSGSSEGTCKTRGKYLNGPKCFSVIEKFKDPTIPTPTPVIYQTDFRYSQSTGPPFCAPVWYAFRYVKNKNGAYGPLSKWSGTSKMIAGIPAAIYSGAENPPCPPTGCQFPLGNKSCALNQPVLSLFGPLDVDALNPNPEDSYTLNVHRQVGTGFDKDGNPQGFDPNSDGEIVGFFLVTPKSALFVDLMFNPNTTSENTCC